MVERQSNVLAGLIITVFISLLTFDSASSQFTITREQVLEDAGKTENLLKKYHPNLYAHRTPKEIRTRWNKAKSEVPENPDFLDAATLMQRMLAAVCDGHTNVNLRDAWNYNHGRMPGYFPFGLVVVRDRLFLDDVKFNKGLWSVTSINGRSSGEIIKFLKSIISADECQRSDVLFSHQVHNRLVVTVLLTGFLGGGKEFEISYENIKTKSTYNATIFPVSLGKLKKITRYKSLRGRSPALRSLGIETDEGDWDYAVDIATQMLVRADAKKSVFYVYLASFNGGKAQAKAIDDRMRDLVKAAPDHVILDLTDNPGGEIVIAQQFLSYFLRTSHRTGVTMRSRINNPVSDPDYIWLDRKSRDSHAGFITQFRKVGKRGGQYRLNERLRSFGNKSYRGKLTVLVSPKTGSAATTVATILKRKAGATIAGDIGDASMTTHCSSAPGTYPLPRSKVGILVPLDCGDRNPAARREGNLLKPDVPVDIAAQESSKTNAAILSAAIESLGLQRVAEVSSSRQPENDLGKSSSGESHDFSISKRTMEVKLSRHPFKTGAAWIGVNLAEIGRLKVGVPELSREPSVLISKVHAGSPADKIGLQAGNILLFVGGAEVHDAETVIESVYLYRPANTITVKILKLADTPAEFISILQNRLASAADRKMAAHILGNLYVFGDYGEANKKESIRLFDLAADLGSANAAAMLGRLYAGLWGRVYFSRGELPVEQNIDQSMKYFTKAAALGETKTMFKLAKIYDDRKRGDTHPELTARYLLHSYQGRYRKARDTLFETPDTWSKEVRVAVQTLLHEAGIYHGKVDGEIDAGTRAAIVRLRTGNIPLPDLPQELPR